MNKKTVNPIFFILILLLLYPACSKKQTPDVNENSKQSSLATQTEADHSEPAPRKQPLKVIVSNDFIREIMYVFANERTKGRVLIPAGKNPLTYLPSEQDKKDILESELVICNGLGLEPGLDTYLTSIQGKVRVATLADGLDQTDLIPSQAYPGGYDPHFWWNPVLWEKAVRHIVSVFIEIDPDFEFNYKSIFIRFGSSLSNLQRYFSVWMDRVPDENRYFLTLNPAFTYFCQAYNLEPLPLLAPGTQELSDERFHWIVDYIIEKRIKTIFPEYQFPQDDIHKILAAVKQKGYSLKLGEELFSYTLGKPGEPEYLYITAGKEFINRVYTWLKPENEPEMPARQRNQQQTGS